MEWGVDAFRRAPPCAIAPFFERRRELEPAVPRHGEGVGRPAQWRRSTRVQVPIKVDAERRPDIRERYPSTTWPAVTLLLPNGVPYFAAKENKVRRA
jgi:hypothetical protein